MLSAVLKSNQPPQYPVSKIYHALEDLESDLNGLSNARVCNITHYNQSGACYSVPLCCLTLKLTPLQFIDHDYLILCILYQECGKDLLGTIFAHCERRPNPVYFRGNQILTQTWDLISFSSKLDHIHNPGKGRAIGLLHLENVKVKHIMLLLHIIQGNACDYVAGGSNCWWFTEGWFLELSPSPQCPND